MKNPPNRQASVDSRRIALQREITLRFPAFDTFITEYSANISTTGMFIVSDDPPKPGTTFNFKFSVADDWKLIRGQGQVIWSRSKEEGANRPPGMGIRFVELDPQSRRLIRWIVEKNIREGGKPFELDELRSAVDEALDGAVEQAGGPVPSPRSVTFPEHVRAVRSVPAGATPVRRRRTPTGWLSAAAVGIVIVALVWLSEVGPRLGGSRSEGAAATAGDADPAVTATNPQPPSDEPPPSTSAASPTRATAAEVGRAVTAWANAWSSQRVDTYLAHYASSFRPPDGLSLDAWRSQRSNRLTRPRFIRVAVSRLETTLEGDGRALARFSQSYRSDTFEDEVLKVLELVWENGSWKIVEERVAG